METAAGQEQTGYFLAGHQAQAGSYHETQTGRDIQMEEPGLLPATCDGHVGVYVRLPATWAETAENNKRAEKRNETHS